MAPVTLLSNLVGHESERVAVPNMRSALHEKEFLEWVAQYAVSGETTKETILDLTAIEEELGLEAGHIVKIAKAAENMMRAHSKYTPGILLAFLFGMWTMEMKWENRESKPITVPE